MLVSSLLKSVPLSWMLYFKDTRGAQQSPVGNPQKIIESTISLQPHPDTAIINIEGGALGQGTGLTQSRMQAELGQILFPGTWLKPSSARVPISDISLCNTSHHRVYAAPQEEGAICYNWPMLAFSIVVHGKNDSF